MPPSDHFRAFARRPTSLPVLIQSDVLGWDLPAELVDLGLGGACVVIAEALPLGSSVRLRVDAPELWEPLLLPGRVAWNRPAQKGRARLGLRFEVESANALAVLAELLGASDNL